MSGGDDLAEALEALKPFAEMDFTGSLVDALPEDASVLHHATNGTCLMRSDFRRAAEVYNRALAR